MPNLNKILLIGHLGKDPVKRYLESGTPMASFSLATTEKWKKDGEKREQTTWHNVIFWGKLAETIETFLSKGDCVYVEGRIQHREYEKDGVTKYITEVVGYQMQMIKVKGRDKPEQQESTPPPSGTGVDDEDLPF